MNFIQSNRVLKTALLACSFLYAGSAFAQPLDFDPTDPFASMGSAMAIEAAGTVLDRKLSYLEINTETRPATAVRKVQEAME